MKVFIRIIKINIKIERKVEKIIVVITLILKKGNKVDSVSDEDISDENDNICNKSI